MKKTAKKKLHKILLKIYQIANWAIKRAMDSKNALNLITKLATENKLDQNTADEWTVSINKRLAIVDAN